MSEAIICFQCRSILRLITADRHEQHVCAKTPYADLSLKVQRQMVDDLRVGFAGDGEPEDWLTVACMRDFRDGQLYTRPEMFDRMAVLLAVCLEFGV